MFESNQLTYFSNLGSYKPRYILARLLIISAAAVLLIMFVTIFAGREPLGRGTMIKIYLLVILAFNSVSEINILAIRYFRRIRKIRGNFYIQSIIILCITILLAFFWINTIRLFILDYPIYHDRITQVAIILGFLILLIHLLIIILSNMSREWLKNQEEIEELKQAKLLSDYNLLKDRLNPHFLFNNLSVLKSLIHYDPGIAEKFTENFTDVYRYVLTSHERQTVSLNEELLFLNSYTSLHKERLGEGLEVNVQVDEELLKNELPPLSLQLLIENAIKHNIANKLHPLVIDIFTRKKKLVVRNNLNKKESTWSSKTGLQTLKAQYRVIANEEITIREDDKHFTVELPLI
ncbi:MAG TPA: histidine kinase [Bacteroidales bacterium]|nr:histidine kinase [Bacteroidales bacterium]